MGLAPAQTLQGASTGYAWGDSDPIVIDGGVASGALSAIDPSGAARNAPLARVRLAHVVLGRRIAGR